MGRELLEKLAKQPRHAAALAEVSADNEHYLCNISIKEANQVADVLDDVRVENDQLQDEIGRLKKCECDLRKIHEGYMAAVKKANMHFQYIGGTLMLLPRC